MTKNCIRYAVKIPTDFLWKCAKIGHWGHLLDPPDKNADGAAARNIASATKIGNDIKRMTSHEEGLHASP